MAVGNPMFVVTIPSHLAHVNCARAFVIAVCKSHGLDDSMTSGIALAVHEAITNVIRHSHHHQYDKVVQIICYPQPDRMEIHVLDEGERFDLTSVPALDPTELRVGGRGVYMMRALFDELTSEPRPEGGNCLRLVKRCSVKFPPPLTD